MLIMALTLTIHCREYKMIVGRGNDCINTWNNCILHAYMIPASRGHSYGH